MRQITIPNEYTPFIGAIETFLVDQNEVSSLTFFLLYRRAMHNSRKTYLQLVVGHIKPLQRGQAAGHLDGDILDVVVCQAQGTKCRERQLGYRAQRGVAEMQLQQGALEALETATSRVQNNLRVVTQVQERQAAEGREGRVIDP